MSEDTTPNTDGETNEEGDITDTDSSGESSESTEGEESLGDPGKKALDAMKQSRNAALRELKEMKAELESLKAEKELAGKSEDEQKLEIARREASEQALAKANERILRSELRLAAKGKLADPADAQLYIDLAEFDVAETGEVDTDALEAAIDDLITRKPHLAAQRSRFQGNADQGAKGSERAPSQLTEAELANMTPAEVNEARRTGRLDTLLKK